MKRRGFIKKTASLTATLAVAPSTLSIAIQPTGNGVLHQLNAAETATNLGPEYWEMLAWLQKGIPN